MADWDDTSPADNDIVSQYPANERDARAAVIANFGVDHHETDDADVGKHAVIQIVDNGGDAAIDAGQVGIWNDGGVLKTRSGVGGVAPLAAFPSGTTMVFYQAAAPVGWTRLSTENDSMLRVVSAANAEAAGTQGGSWTISGLTVQGHSLTIGQLPSHNHGGGGSTSDDTHNHSGTTTSDSHNHTVFTGGNTDSVDAEPGGGPAFTAVGTSNQATSSDSHDHSLNINNDTHNHTFNIPNQGSGNTHNHGISHDGSWRPKYLNVLVASKD